MTIPDIRLGLREFLHDDPGIAAVVGATLASARIYPVVMAQGNLLACIVFTKISGQGDHYMQGPTGLARPRYQIDAWAPSADVATALGNLVKERLDGFKGPMPYGSNSPQATITVQGAFFTDEREDYDAEKKMHRVSRDYFIWHREY